MGGLQVSPHDLEAACPCWPDFYEKRHPTEQPSISVPVHSGGFLLHSRMGASPGDIWLHRRLTSPPERRRDWSVHIHDSRSRPCRALSGNQGRATAVWRAAGYRCDSHTPSGCGRWTASGRQPEPFVPTSRPWTPGGSSVDANRRLLWSGPVCGSSPSPRCSGPRSDPLESGAEEPRWGDLHSVTGDGQRCQAQVNIHGVAVGR